MTKNDKTPFFNLPKSHFSADSEFPKIRFGVPDPLLEQIICCSFIITFSVQCQKNNNTLFTYKR